MKAGKRARGLVWLCFGDISHTRSDNSTVRAGPACARARTTHTTPHTSGYKRVTDLTGLKTLLSALSLSAISCCHLHPALLTPFHIWRCDVTTLGSSAIYWRAVKRANVCWKEMQFVRRVRVRTVKVKAGQKGEASARTCPYTPLPPPTRGQPLSTVSPPHPTPPPVPPPTQRNVWGKWPGWCFRAL